MIITNTTFNGTDKNNREIKLYTLRKYLRETFGIILFITPCWNDDETQEGYGFELCRVNENKALIANDKVYETIEESLTEGIIEAVKLI